MELSLVQAASLTGRSKSTIHRAIKSGKLSASRRDDGSYSISPAELFRVFPKDSHETSHETQKEAPMKQHETPTHEVAFLQMKVEMLSSQLEREQETVADLRKRLDKAEDRLLALSPPHQSTQSKMGFWGKIWGRG